MMMMLLFPIPFAMLEPSRCVDCLLVFASVQSNDRLLLLSPQWTRLLTISRPNDGSTRTREARRVKLETGVWLPLPRRLLVQGNVVLLLFVQKFIASCRHSYHRITPTPGGWRSVQAAVAASCVASAFYLALITAVLRQVTYAHLLFSTYIHTSVFQFLIAGMSRDQARCGQPRCMLPVTSATRARRSPPSTRTVSTAMFCEAWPPGGSKACPGRSASIKFITAIDLFQLNLASGDARSDGSSRAATKDREEDHSQGSHCCAQVSPPWPQVILHSRITNQLYCRCAIGR